MTPEQKTYSLEAIEATQDYQDLYAGLRDQQDPVTWRTTVLTIGALLGVEDPEHQKAPSHMFDQALTLTKKLVSGTYSELLLPEILLAVGFDRAKELDRQDLDVLLINARHYPEELLWKTADDLKKQGKRVAVINPIGHHNDGQTRTLGPRKMLRNIDSVAFLASTQSQRGGDWGVLTRTLNVLENASFTRHIKNKVHVIIPMWGGDRGHRPGQRNSAGYEVLEAPTDAKMIALTLDDIWTTISRKIKGKLPELIVESIDIHNQNAVERILREKRIDFGNLDPAAPLAAAILEEHQRQKLTHLPLKFVACDQGAIPRTESLVRHTLAGMEDDSDIDVIYMKKNRITAGLVKDTQILKVIRWHKDKKGKITKHKIDKDSILDDESIVILSDDMLDTGNSVRADKAYISKKYPHIQKWWFVGSHPVLSKGENNLADIGVDLFILGNTLSIDDNILEGLIKSVDLAPTITSALLGLNEEKGKKKCSSSPQALNGARKY